MKFTWLIFFLIIFTCLVIFSNNMYQPIKEGVDANSVITPARNYKYYNGNTCALEGNMAISFDMKINSSFGDWQQVIGITPDSGGSDQRVLAIWLCPGTTNLYIRTATTNNGGNSTNWDDNIAGCSINLPTGQWLNVTVIGNINTNTSQYPYTQNWNVYINGNLIVNTNLYRSWFPIATKQVYVMATYNNFNPFNGQIGNVTFLSTNSQITYDIIQQHIRPILYSGFTNMNVQEGMTAEVAATGKPDSSYVPIKDENGNPMCPNTILYKDQDNSKAKDMLDNNLNLNTNGMKVPVCPPDDIYKIQSVILKQLNDFNAEYSKYITYKYNTKHTGNGDTTPLLKYSNATTTDAQLSGKYSKIDKITQLSSYQTLNDSLKTYTNLVGANQKYYPSSGDKRTVGQKTNDMSVSHGAIMRVRNDLDNKLYELNSMEQSLYGDSKLQMDSSIYVTILWTTLATSLVYYMFVHM